MKAMLLPFGYPGYPQDVMFGRIDEGKKYLSELGIEFESADSIIELKDCAGVLEKMKSSQFEYIICMVATWIEVTNVMELVYPFRHLPMLLWCHENIKDPNNKEVLSLGAIASAGVLRESFEEFEFNFKFIVGNPFDIKIAEDIKVFDKAAKTLASLVGSRIGLVGYTSLGMYTGMADHIKVKKFFGAELFHVDQYSVLNKLENVDPVLLEQTVNMLRDCWDIDPQISIEYLDKTARLYVRFKDLMKANLLNSLTVKCQYEMSVEYNFSPCVSLSILGMEYPVACEGDVHQVLSQMILSGLSQKVTTYGDVLDFLEDGIVCAACGFAPKCFLKPEKPKISCHTAIVSGLLITSPFKEDKITMIRLANKGNGYKMHLIKGRIEELKDFHEIGCPQYAGSVIRFENKTAEEFKNEIMSQHYAIVSGDYEKVIREYCRLMKIEVI